MLGPIPFTWHSIEPEPETRPIFERLNPNLQTVRVGNLKAPNQPRIVARDVPDADRKKPRQRTDSAR